MWRQSDVRPAASQLRERRGLPGIQLRLPSSRTNLSSEACVEYVYSFCVPLSSHAGSSSSSAAGGSRPPSRASPAPRPVAVPSSHPFPSTGLAAPAAAPQQRWQALAAQPHSGQQPGVQPHPSPCHLPPQKQQKQHHLAQPQGTPRGWQALPIAPLRIEGFNIAPLSGAPSALDAPLHLPRSHQQAYMQPPLLQQAAAAQQGLCFQPWLQHPPPHASVSACGWQNAAAGLYPAAAPACELASVQATLLAMQASLAQAF